MMKRVMRLTVEVTVPAATAEHDVEEAINAALDEPPCEWGDWTVGEAIIVDVTKHDDGR